ncbi:thiamine pyrophosphate-binding protein [Geomonas sp. RF6]|uniref:thiamine pyrophosphate-binding protein n=1 Tax=Geomonas sp. RF6 TaxID=2897342 RepID=UPI001E30FC72|nr:thiamine pyrophosphate-binding protein [Geomonas sp. RF6]UFS71310.1 thiamine pyrophosphate-binding protein [Geomonas sp. RF6]
MKLSDYVIDFLVRQGVNHIFEFVGGAITHLLDSASYRHEISCVSVHHEQSGAFAAEAYARINGSLGVAMATSGPGALNLLTGIGSCYFDSVPCLFITGQVNTYEYKFEKPVRQIGFQETDIVSVVRPLTKYAQLVTSAGSIRYELEKAVYLARGGRPGPVLLDIPMNIQRAHIEPEELASFFDSAEYGAMEQGEPSSLARLDDIVELMVAAKRPVILAGGGVRSANAADELERLVRRTRIPVVSSLMGLDAVSHEDPLFTGMIGAYGNRYSNLAVANCDFLLILGSRLDSRQTGTRPDTFARAARKVQVDTDAVELQARVAVDIAVHCHLKPFLEGLNRKLTGYSPPDRADWLAVLDRYRAKFPTRLNAPPPEGVDPNLFMEILSAASTEGDIVTLDVGQNQMWAAQSFRLKKGQRMLISGGMGAMGFALPAAIGAAKAAPGRSVIAIAGDGGIQVNIQELDLVARQQLPIKIVVLNNACLGMVRQFQDMYFGGRRQSTVIGYGCPDLIKVAEAYGVPAYRISGADAPEVLAEALAAKGPAFVEVMLEQGTTVNPKLVVNRPIEDMSPHLDREELAREMLIDLVEEMEVP